MSNATTWIENSPLNQTDKLRICQVRAIGSVDIGLGPHGTPITKAMDFGRLESQISAAGTLTPRLAASSGHAALEIAGSTSENRTVAWRRLLIRTHANHLVDVRMFATDWRSLEDTISLLEDLYYENVSGEPDDWDYGEYETEIDMTPKATQPFHQLIFVADSEPEPDWETTQRLIYRADLLAIEEQSNRRPGQLAAVGTFASVLWGLQYYVEKATVLSAALTVAALECIRTIRLEAIDRYQQIIDSPADGSVPAAELKAIHHSKPT